MAVALVAAVGLLGPFPLWVSLTHLVGWTAWTMLLLGGRVRSRPYVAYLFWAAPTLLFGGILVKHQLWPDGYEFWSIGLFLFTQLVTIGIRSAYET